MKKEDIRITKTKRDLHRALMELMTEIPFEKITVSQLCEHALVNRMTFYKYYTDKYDLLQSAVDSVIETVAERHAAANVGSPSDNPVRFCSTLTETVIEECLAKKDLIEAMVRQDNSLLTEIVTSSIRRSVELLIEALAERNPTKYPVRAISSFITGGASQTVVRWLTQPSPYTKELFLESATRLVTDLLKSGIFFENKIPCED